MTKLKTLKDEEYLDKEFPKGKTKFRGQAMILLALAREVGEQAERKKILDEVIKIVNEWYQVSLELSLPLRLAITNGGYIKKFDLLKRLEVLKKSIEGGQK